MPHFTINKEYSFYIPDTFLAIYAYLDAIRVFTPQREVTLTGPYTHSLAGQFLVNIYPPPPIDGPVFKNLYPANTPVIKSWQHQPPEGLKGLGRPFAFSAPCRTQQYLWFLLEGHDFAAFQKQTRYCQRKADEKRGVLHIVFNREVYRITPYKEEGQSKAQALDALLTEIMEHFPPIDQPCGPHHINTFSVYSGANGPAKLPRTLRPWANHVRYRVARIDLVDPALAGERDEWNEATVPPTQQAISKGRADFRKPQEPELEIPGLIKQQEVELDQQTHSTSRPHEMGGMGGP